MKKILLRWAQDFRFQVLVGFFLLTILMFSSLALNSGNTVLDHTLDTNGHGRDKWHFIWNFWWFRTALTTGQDLFQTQMMFFPEGASLIFHTIDIFDAAVSSIISNIVGDVVAFNIIIISSLALSGFTAFLLAWHLTKNKIASIGAGLIFAYFPQHIAQAFSGHPNLSSIQWLPAYLLALILTYEHRRIRYAITAGIFLIILTFIDLQLIVMAAIVTLIYFSYQIYMTKGKIINSRTFFLTAIIGLIWLGTAGPYIYSVTSHIADGERSPPSLEETILNSARPQFYLIQSPYNFLYGDIFNENYSGLGGGVSQHVIFMGWTALFLAIIGIVNSRNEWKYFLIALGFTSFILSLGPSNANLDLSIQTPYNILYQQSSIIQFFRAPARFSIITMLSISGLAALGIESVTRTRNLHIKIPQRLIKEKNNFNLIFSKKIRKIITFSLLLLILIEFTPSINLESIETNPVYDIIAADNEEFGVLELPNDIVNTQKYLYQQTLHEKPLVNGKIAQGIDTLPDYISKQPLFQELINPRRSNFRNNIIDQGYETPDFVNSIFNQYNIKYVVVHTKELSEKEFLKINSILTQSIGNPIYVDEDASLFSLINSTIEENPVMSTVDKPIILLGEGWTQVRDVDIDYYMVNEKGEIKVHTDYSGLYLIRLNSSETACFTNRNSSSSKNVTLINSSMRFNGKDQYIDVDESNDLTFPNEFTLEAWINIETLNQMDNVIITKGASQNLNYRLVIKSQKAELRVFDTLESKRVDAVSNTIINEGKWYHIVATYDSTRIRIFINGVEEDNVIFSGQRKTSDDNIIIGKGSGDEGFFNGRIDEIHIYNVAKNISWIRESYLGNHEYDESGLIIHYEFEDDANNKNSQFFKGITYGAAITKEVITSNCNESIPKLGVIQYAYYLNQGENILYIESVTNFPIKIYDLQINPPRPYIKKSGV